MTSGSLNAFAPWTSNSEPEATCDVPPRTTAPDAAATAIAAVAWVPLIRIEVAELESSRIDCDATDPPFCEVNASPTSHWCENGLPTEIATPDLTLALPLAVSQRPIVSEAPVGE